MFDRFSANDGKGLLLEASKDRYIVAHDAVVALMDATSVRPAQIIELKRGSHRLSARRGTPAERSSQPLGRALRQVQSYGETILSDIETRTHPEEVHDLELDRLELRLVAGRRLTDPASYHLRSCAAPDDGMSVSIST